MCRLSHETFYFLKDLNMISGIECSENTLTVFLGKVRKFWLVNHFCWTSSSRDRVGGQDKKNGFLIFFSIGGIFFTSADPPCQESTDCCLRKYLPLSEVFKSSSVICILSSFFTRWVLFVFCNALQNFPKADGPIKWLPDKGFAF